MWKRLVLALSLVLFVTTSISAKDFRYYACTADNKYVTTYFALKDAVIEKDPRIPARIEAAFKKAAARLDAETFSSVVGLLTFLSYLTKEDVAALPDDGIATPHIMLETCPSEGR